MKIDTLLKRGIVFVRVEGDLDIYSSDYFRKAVDAALERSDVKNIVFDLQGVGFIDSSGLGVILGRYKRICAYGGVLMVVHIQPPVEKILEMSGLNKMIRIYDSEEEALASL